MEKIISNPLVGQNIIDLGLIDYAQAWQVQKEAVLQVLSGGEERVFFCEHPPVLTLGRLAKREHILVPSEELARHKVEVIDIDRGGEVTLHCPGQLVVYPILRLDKRGKDLHGYLRKLEEVTIDLLKDFGILANSLKGLTGVWVGKNKIASIGVGVKKWVSYHGLALNVNSDLELFKLIRPCGLDVSMTSLKRELKNVISLAEVKVRFRERFNHQFLS